MLTLLEKVAIQLFSEVKKKDKCRKQSDQELYNAIIKSSPTIFKWEVNIMMKMRTSWWQWGPHLKECQISPGKRGQKEEESIKWITLNSTILCLLTFWWSLSPKISHVKLLMLDETDLEILVILKATSWRVILYFQVNLLWQVYYFTNSYTKKDQMHVNFKWKKFSTHNYRFLPWRKISIYMGKEIRVTVWKLMTAIFKCPIYWLC